MSMNTFFRHFDPAYVKGEVILRTRYNPELTVVTTYPNYLSGKKDSSMYSDYCKYKLIKLKEWKNNILNLLPEAARAKPKPQDWIDAYE